MAERYRELLVTCDDIDHLLRTYACKLELRLGDNGSTDWVQTSAADTRVYACRRLAHFFRNKGGCPQFDTRNPLTDEQLELVRQRLVSAFVVTAYDVAGPSGLPSRGVRPTDEAVLRADPKLTFSRGEFQMDRIVADLVKANVPGFKACIYMADYDEDDDEQFISLLDGKGVGTGDGIMVELLFRPRTDLPRDCRRRVLELANQYLASSA